MMESQTLLLTLLSMRLALLEERLQEQALELQCQLLLWQKHQELAATLKAQVEGLGYF